MNGLPIHSARAAMVMTCALAAGCASVAGVGGSADYGCKAPEGVKCDSVAGTYARSLDHALPGQRPTRGGTSSKYAVATLSTTRADAGGAMGSSEPAPIASRWLSPSAAHPSLPLRSPPRVLRLWVKPWEDADGDLMDQLYVYVPVDNGRWLIDHIARPIRDVSTPIRAPARPVPGEAARASTLPDRDPLRIGTGEPPQRAPASILPREGDANGDDDAP